jgi:hypothetical protein
MTGWLDVFEKIGWRMNARNYAERLPRWLIRAFGPRDFYSEPQIFRAIQECGLNSKFKVLAYAMFLPESEFDNLISNQSLSYQAARQIFLGEIPVRATSHSGDAPRNAIEDRGGFGQGLDQ